ncbi:hypothetical protein RF11_07395 [Thelohanellus kitauei]|uniref:Ig-like domain-containing protein n=1 Tax=Thelohanellus kitauei TaxID=669202 RepID=A0A0C2NGH7_THEKT|nr:hypothetical protein RF11_07395 [Thelohanellus kitauei]
MECLLNTFPDNVLWLFDGDAIARGNSNLQFSESYLILKSVNMTHTGKYTCLVVQNGTQFASSLFLEVTGVQFLKIGKNNTNPQDKDFFANTSVIVSKAVLNAGQTFYFKVLVPEFCSITRLKDGEATYSYYSEYPGIYIPEVKYEDSGLYQLIIECGKNMLSYTIPLLVGGMSVNYSAAFGRDDSLITIEQHFNHSYVVKWYIPVFLSTYVKEQCLDVFHLTDSRDPACIS